MRYLLVFILLLFCNLQAQDAVSDTVSRRDLLGPVRVSKIHSMDDVRGTYKSPRRAMFMSLILPGSGQLYVRGTSSNIYRGAFYLAEEIALITGLYYNSIYRYDKQVKEYQNFAKNNFSVIEYERKMNGLYDEMYENMFNTLYGSHREEYCKSIYGDQAITTDRCTSFLHGSDFAKTNYEQNKNSMYKPADFYRIISDETFILGWNDAIDNPNLANYQDPDNLYYVPLGTSANYKTYKDMRKKATNLADRQVWFLGALIVNHIVSAVDAALSARAHNNRLYEESVSWLDNINFTGTLEPGLDLKVGLLAWLSI